MSADTRTRRFPERTVRQVRLDCVRALIRAGFCPDRSEVLQIRCVDDRPEHETRFGNQLWYFEGLGVDESDRRHRIHGAVEYSLQFGLHDLVEDGVFDSEYQRDRFRLLYEREVQKPSWRHPAHRWLIVGLIAIATIWLAYLIARNLMS